MNNFTERNVFTDAFMAAINCMSIKELQQARDILNFKIEAAAQKHIVAIRAAIEAAKNDGFDVEIGHENTLDFTTFTEYDSTATEVNVY